SGGIPAFVPTPRIMQDGWARGISKTVRPRPIKTVRSLLNLPTLAINLSGAFLDFWRLLVNTLAAFVNFFAILLNLSAATGNLAAAKRNLVAPERNPSATFANPSAAQINP
ncbi:MAG TPA: hypothetical protein VGC89_17200, partial [Pyrinomonadaceae bacterium]